MIDIIKSQKKLSPDEIVSLKERRDEFTIQRKKLKIAYEFPIGNGASSSVYLGFLYGISPLSLITGLIETQKFRDCKVAVKVPSSFGFDESEQLFREIETMKKIGYNEHVICMLGICLLNEKPVLVFEKAEKDLLEYVKTFREGEMLRARSYLNSFFSILWQVAKGKIVNRLKIGHTNRLMTDPRRL